MRREEIQRVQYTDSAERQVMLRDDRRAIVAALRSLPQRQREALVLRYWLDLREAEIAGVMHISAGAVKTHIFRGKAALKRVMRKEFSEDRG
jgi:RNA polymerase sigma factor (sigma-70 family)